MAPPYDAWFIMADEDRDGMIAGAEAVRFFQRSGLAQECLGQIWELASAGGPKLNMIQFSSAMRLVSLAQSSNGRLPLEPARALVAGMGPSVGPPRMQGLESGPATGYSPQVTGGNPGYSPQVTGGYVAPPTYSAQSTGQQQYGQQQQQASGSMPSYSPQVTGQYAQQPQQQQQQQQYGQPPGQQYAQQPTAAYNQQRPAGPPAVGGFVPASVADMTRYQAAFVSLDTDHDGIVKGSDCFGFFLQWGLDKALLRDVWTLVAGNAGHLDRHQFVTCLYLMDAAKLRGAPLPAVLPQGQFPPVALAGAAPAPVAAPHAPWSLQSQFGAAGASTAAAPPPVLPTFAPLPTRVEFGTDATVAAGAAFASKAPTVAADTLASFTNAEKAKVASELKQAEERETRAHAAEEEATRARAKQAAYNAAMQEVLVFKSRMDVGLLQAQDQAERLKAEADDIKRRYDQSYARAQIQNAEAAKLREAMSKLVTERDEAAERLQQLEAEVATAGALTPDVVARMDAELRALQEQVAQAEAQHSAKTVAMEGYLKQREVLQKQLADAQAVAAEVEAQAEAGRKEVDAITAQVVIARASGSATLTSELLVKTSAAYTRLAQQALKSGLELPAQAHLASLPVLTWFEDVVAGTADWKDEEDAGFVLVNALPGQATPRALQAAAATEAAAAPVAEGAVAADGTAAAATGFDEDAFGGDVTLPAAPVAHSKMSEMGAAGAAAAAAAAAIAALFPRFSATGEDKEEVPVFKPFVEGKGFGGGDTMWQDTFQTSFTDDEPPAVLSPGASATTPGPSPLGGPYPAQPSVSFPFDDDAFGSAAQDEQYNSGTTVPAALSTRRSSADKAVDDEVAPAAAAGGFGDNPAFEEEEEPAADVAAAAATSPGRGESAGGVGSPAASPVAAPGMPAASGKSAARLDSLFDDNAFS